MHEENIVILGAGYGGLKVTQRLSELIGNQKENPIILVNKHNFHMFMTQLHESATGTSEFEDVSVPIEKVLEGKNVTFIKGWVDNIDLKKRAVFISKGEKALAFKYLVIALGSEPEYYNIPGLKENSMCLRSLYSSLEIRRRIEKILRELQNEPAGPRRQKMLTFVVGGGGLTGVEFAGELAHQLQQVKDDYQIEPGEYRIIMVEGAKELLPGLCSDLACYTRRTLEDMGVEVLTEEFVKEVTPQTIYLSSGKEIPYSLLIWAGGVKGNRVLAQSGFLVEARGRVPVNEHLQYTEDPYVYLVGDNALAIDLNTDKPVLPTAQSAMQQGEIAAYNIYADITGQEKKAYRPSAIGTLISIGRGRGLGEMKAFRLKGAAAAWLKELIPIKYRYSLGGLKMLVPGFLNPKK